MPFKGASLLCVKPPAAKTAAQNKIRPNVLERYSIALIIKQPDPHCCAQRDYIDAPHALNLLAGFETEPR
jgi:hypothetical protein